MAETAQLSVPDLGNILGIWAHPDDETFSSAGIMVLALDNGQEVACLTATKGEVGIQDSKRWPQEKLAEIRAMELGAAFKVLGVENHHWLGYKDGDCHNVDFNEALSKIRGFIDDFKPDTILTFGPDGMTGHTDHQTVSLWATEIGKQLKIRVLHATLTHEMYDNHRAADDELNIFFNIDRPSLCYQEECTVYIRLDEALIDKKLNALKAMPSQTEKMINTLGENTVRSMISEEAFVLA